MTPLNKNTTDLESVYSLAKKYIEDVDDEVSTQTSLLDELDAAVDALPDAGGAKITLHFTVDGTAFTWETYEGHTKWIDFLSTDYARNAGFKVCGASFYDESGSSKEILRPSLTSSPLRARAIDDIINGQAYTSGCCFTAGTQVLVSLDGKTKNIEDILCGDSVVSHNIETGENYIAKAAKLILNKHSIEMARVEFANGAVLEMTDYHPIYTVNGWHSITDKKYEKLVVGDMARTSDGWSEIVDIVQYSLDNPIITYTLAVVDDGETLDTEDDTNDNYFANGIMVHNAEGGCYSVVYNYHDWE